MHLLAHNRYLKMYPISCFFVSGHLVHFCISNLFAYINIIFIFFSIITEFVPPLVESEGCMFVLEIFLNHPVSFLELDLILPIFTTAVFIMP